jgi:hypothetical protein
VKKTNKRETVRTKLTEKVAATVIKSGDWEWNAVLKKKIG